MKKKVVYCDDDDHLLRMVSSFLEEKGFTVIASSNPFIAPLIDRERPDVIIMDIDMPLLRGDQIVSILENYGYTEEIPVIYFSGKEAEQILQIVRRTPCSSYVKKESGLDALYEKIKQVIGLEET